MSDAVVDLGEYGIARLPNVNADGLLGNADLVTFTDDGRALRRIGLPDEAEPAMLAATPDQMLVSDPYLARLFAVSTDDFMVGDFPRGELARQLEILQAERET